MDLASPIGIVVSIGIMLFGIVLLGGEIGNFIDIPSVMLVIIPTFAAMFIAFPTKQLLALLKHFPIILGIKKYNPVSQIDLISTMAETARSKGLIALEAEVANIQDKFMKNAVQLAADAAEPERISERLYGYLDSMTKRHAQSWAIYDKGAAFAPAFGMCATVISLVNMLMSLDFSDANGVSSLGGNMAAAMITTFYGSLLANVFFIPLCNKLRLRHQEEMFCKELVIDGILAIQKGINPRDIKDMLVERLDPKIAEKIAASTT